MNGFQLFSEGRFDEAIAAFTDELEERPTAPTFANRGMAYLSVGNLAAALADYRAADQAQRQQPGGVSDAYLKRIGAVLWMMGQKSEAAKVWLSVLDGLMRSEFKFSDAAGGVQAALLLWFAGISEGKSELLEPAVRFRSDKLRKATANNWPGPIAEGVKASLFSMTRETRAAC